ncbi:MAG: hypothetical protein NBV67_02145 [Tagaea sp.]|nr:hypothetical protein [Tagaea sp.]
MAKPRPIVRAPKRKSPPSAGRRFGAAAIRKADAAGGKTKKLSARVPESLIAQAREVSGIERDGDLVKAGLAALAAPNAFGAWLIANEGTLPEDFELDV